MKTPKTRNPNPGKALSVLWKRLAATLRRQLKKLRKKLKRPKQPASLSSSTDPPASGEAPVLQQRQDFVHRLSALVEKHHSDPSFSAELLSQKLFMSYSTCLRKVKAATGMAIKEYIRHIRIQKGARRLLKEPKRPISEIALDVGFTSGTYFSREFRRAMGCSPTAYRRQNKGSR